MQQIRKHGGNIREISLKYKIPEEKILDFSANINPLGPPQNVIRKLGENLHLIARYPDSQSSELKITLANYLNIDKNTLVLGNGASELIFLIVNSLKPAKVWIPTPTFSEYELASLASGAQVVRLSLDKENFNKFNMQDLRDFGKNDLIFICNPNNPTGQLYERKFLLEIIELVNEKEGFIIIDESFLDFLEEREKITFLNKYLQFPKLIVLYSLTKFFTLPGVRLGALIAEPNLARKFDIARDPWNINVFAQIAGVEALQDKDFIQKSLDFFREERKYVYSRLQEMSGIKVFQPTANYVFIRLEKMKASYLQDLLAQRGIMIRNCNTYPLLGENFIRIAIKKRKENIRLLDKLKAILER